MRNVGIWLAGALLALSGCQIANAKEKAPKNDQATEWKSRVKEARDYGEKRAHEPKRVQVQSAIGVQVMAGEPKADAKKQTSAAAPPKVSVVEGKPLKHEDLSRMREHARNAVSVVMYATSWCGICSVARDHMRQHRIGFVERNVETRPKWKERLLELNPKGSVPTFDVDGLVMVGFGEEQLDQLIARAGEARLERLTSGPKTILVSPP